MGKEFFCPLIKENCRTDCAFAHESDGRVVCSISKTVVSVIDSPL